MDIQPNIHQSPGLQDMLEVIANGNGFGKGTHVSVFLHFMRGEFDDYLKNGHFVGLFHCDC